MVNLLRAFPNDLIMHSCVWSRLPNMRYVKHSQPGDAQTWVTAALDALRMLELASDSTECAFGALVQADPAAFADVSAVALIHDVRQDVCAALTALFEDNDANRNCALESGGARALLERMVVAGTPSRADEALLHLILTADQRMT